MRCASVIAFVSVCIRLLAQAPAEPPSRHIIANPAWSHLGSTLVDVSRERTARHPAKLSNLSARALAGTGFETLIAGAVVRGEGTLPTLVRAIGPGLAAFNVPNFVRQPILEVFQESNRAAETTRAGPGTAALASYVGAFPAIETGSLTAGNDAAVGGHASAGTLTAHCVPADNVPGVGLLEFYDASAATSAGAARFINLSARARVQADEAIMVLGFVVSGEGSTTLLLRGVGSTLTGIGIPNALPNPLIELYSGADRIAVNDNWRTGDASGVRAIEDAQSAVRALPLESENDAALLVNLPAGAYTLQVSGGSGEGGIALAEIHVVDQQPFDPGQSINAVGLDVLRQLAASRATENLILSPYSIESALALAYTGAAGGTREEMARVLRLPADNAALQRGMGDLQRGLEEMVERSQLAAAARPQFGAPAGPIEWNVANRLFGQNDFAFRETFLTLLRDGFQAPLEPLDFRNSTEAARITINQWVEQETREKIRNLIPPGGVTVDTRLVLVNALYLNAPWDVPFSKTATAPKPFRPATGSVRDVPTMQRTDNLAYAKEPGFSVVGLDYVGRDLQFVVVLPDETETVESISRRLTVADFARWAKLGETGRTRVALSFPKFRVEGSTVPLGTALRALGMTQAFDQPPGSANFDGIAPINGSNPLAISDVFHQTFIAIDEEGTEAAAATAVVIGVTSVIIEPPPIELRVDRPFLFAIQHKPSGACLFLGRMVEVP